MYTNQRKRQHLGTDVSFSVQGSIFRRIDGLLGEFRVGGGAMTVTYSRADWSVFCIGRFCRARRPAHFWWRPALFKKPKWCPAFKKKKYQSHMAFSSVLPFLLPTHSVDCAVHLLLCHSRALLVNSALFLPFTVLIMPFFFSSPR